jgi:hypothetical protein
MLATSKVSIYQEFTLHLGQMYPGSSSWVSAMPSSKPLSKLRTLNIERDISARL